MATHTYRTSLTWKGSTGEGYDAYDRGHVVQAAGPAPVRMSSDPAFRGDVKLLNPEQLLLAAASSCQFLSFAAVAARARLDVVEYSDHAEAVMPEGDRPMRITEIVLRPRIVLRGGGAERVPRLVEVAHRECFIAHSVTARIRIEPTVVEADQSR